MNFSEFGEIEDS